MELGQLEPGEMFTVSGVTKRVPSGRKWWQLWLPRYLESDELAVFRVTATSCERLS